MQRDSELCNTSRVSPSVKSEASSNGVVVGVVP
jgi:hypothetical protein